MTLPAPMILLVLWVLVAMAAVMVAAWFWQRRAGNAGWIDVFWTFGTGAACALAALAPFGGRAGPDWRQVLVAALLAVWSLRLGLYVALRVARSPEDVRYAELRREWGGRFQRRMFGLMIIQAPVTAVLSISVLYAARTPDPALRPADVAGVLVLAAAILGEGAADSQMRRFRADPANHGRVCDRGLWGWSRHPNYFFEWMGWLAYPIIALDPARLSTLLSLIAPVVMFLVVRIGTGVPPLEAAMVRSRGEAYRRYQARVNAFWPLPPRAALSSSPAVGDR